MQLTHGLFYSKQLFKFKIESKSKTYHWTLGETPTIHSQRSVEDFKISQLLRNYYDSVLLSFSIDLFRFEVTWSVMGKQDKEKWRLRVVSHVEKEEI